MSFAQRPGNPEPWLLERNRRVEHYQVIRPLGRGAMAEVYLARDVRLGRKVALKLVRPEMLGKKEAVERFLFEAKTTATFNHPNIVTIHAVGESEGVPFLALEYLKGQTLRQRMEEGPQNPAAAARIARAVAEALAEAHGHKVQHRDLKPENVMLTGEGAVKVLDFGLARVFHGNRVDPAGLAGEPDAGDSDLDATSTFRSQAGTLRGSPAYMSPEHWRREETTGAADTWALGVILFEMLSGRRPFPQEDILELRQRVCSDEPAPRLNRDLGVPADMAAVIDGCLAKQAVNRPPARQVADRLRATLSRRTSPAEEKVPFRGLLPFSERDQGFFHGRELEIGSFVERARTTPMLTVVGPSGVGKSSFVMAGFIPRLREQQDVLVIRVMPGRRPIEALVKALLAAFETVNLTSLVDELLESAGAGSGPHADAASRSTRLQQALRGSHQLLGLLLHRAAVASRSTVVLFVDQLEEVCLAEAQSDGHDFLGAVCGAADDPDAAVRVVTTLREEFLSRVVQLAGERAAFEQVVVLRRPSPQMLVDAMRLPVEALGYRYDDPRLVEDMVSEVKSEISCLPLLQFTGRMLWESRDKEGRVLTRAAYTSLGGVSGALVQHADGVFSALTEEDTGTARTLLLRLVTHEGTRRIQSKEKLLEGTGPGGERMLERLVEARLVTSRTSPEAGQGEFELVHEALVHTWGRLSGWISQGREELRRLGELELAADLWEKRGLRDVDLWRGKAHREAVQVAGTGRDLPGAVTRFLQACARRRRRVRSRVFVLAVLGVTLVTGAYIGGRHLHLSSACSDSTAKLAGIWDRGAQDKIRRAFIATKKPYATDAWLGVRARFDSYARAWLATRKDACEATWIRREQSEEMLDLRMQCLGHRLQEWKELVDVFGDADAQVVERAVQASHGLEHPGACSDQAALRARVRPPRDETTRERVAAVRTDLARARSLQQAGKYTQGFDIAAEAARQASELAYRPVEAESYELLARLEEDLGHSDRAEENLRKAWWSAQAAGMDDLATRASTTLARVVGVRLGRRDDFANLIRHAESHLERLGPSPRMQAEWHRVQGLMAMGKGHLVAASGNYRRSLDLLRGALGDDHPDVAVVLTALAKLSFDRGDYEKALSYEEQALQIIEAAFGKNHPKMAKVLTALCRTHRRLSKYDQAMQACKRSLAIREGALGKEHPDTARSLVGIALVLGDMGEYDRAIEHYQRVVRINEAAYGEEHPSLDATLNNLGILHDLKGDWERARTYYRRVLGRAQKRYGPEHPLVASSLLHLGIACYNQAEHGKALDLARQAMALYQKIYGKDHIFVSNCLNQIGKSLRALGKPQEALARYRQALAIQEKSFKDPHQETAATLMNTGDVHLDQGSYRKAREFYQRALDVVSKTLGDDHPLMAEALLGMGRVDAAEKRIETAGERLEMILTICGAKPCEPRVLQTARFLLARHLWASGAHRPRAVRLATQAAEGLSALPLERARHAEVLAWLRAKQAKPGDR